jgi:uncharacterized protein with HEPN domain
LKKQESAVELRYEIETINALLTLLANIGENVSKISQNLNKFYKNIDFSEFLT